MRKEVPFFRNGIRENRNFLHCNNLLLDARGNGEALLSQSGFPVANIHQDLQYVGFARDFLRSYRTFLDLVHMHSEIAEARAVAGKLLKNTSETDQTFPVLSAHDAKVLGEAVVNPYLDAAGKKRWFRFPVLKEWQKMSQSDIRKRDLTEYSHLLLVIRDCSADAHASAVAADVLSRPLEADGTLSLSLIEDLGDEISFSFPNGEGKMSHCRFKATAWWKKYVESLKKGGIE